MPYVPDETRDQRMEVAMGTLLRVGVIAAAVLVAIGGLLLLRHPGAPLPDYRVFHPPVHDAVTGGSFDSISGVFRQLHTGDSATIIALGLLVLIATPIARVVFAIIGFSREHDWLYTAVSVVVLCVLLFSLMHGR